MPRGPVEHVEVSRCRDIPGELVAAQGLVDVAADGAVAVAELESRRVDEGRRPVREVVRIGLERQRGLHLPPVAEALGRGDVDAPVNLVVGVRHRDVAEAGGTRAPIADDVVRRALVRHRVGVGRRGPHVDVRQRVPRGARLIADRVVGRAAIVLPIDEVDREREVWNQLVLHPDDRLARATDLGARIDDIARRQELAR